MRHADNIDYDLIKLIITVYATVTLLPIAYCCCCCYYCCFALALAVLHVFTCVRTGTRPTKNIRGFMKTGKAWSVSFQSIESKLGTAFIIIERTVCFNHCIVPNNSAWSNMV